MALPMSTFGPPAWMPKRELEIVPGHFIGDGHPPYFIAEIGINHNGELDLAKELISKAKSAGADCVKFQKRTISRILTRKGLEAKYDDPRRSFAPEGNKTYGAHKEQLELTAADYRELLAYCAEKNVGMSASGWDEEAIDFLDDLGIPFFKMASADLRNTPLLEHTARKGKPMVLSTGMADMESVVQAVRLVTAINPRVVLLQCTSTYPCSPAEENLKVIETYKLRFPSIVIGYSGHSEGDDSTLGAVAMGAQVVERHITLDRSMKGGDHKASVLTSNLPTLIERIHSMHGMIGDPVKRCQESEAPIYVKLAKSVVSARDIKKGEVLEPAMLTTKGPGHGISPDSVRQLVLGRKALQDIAADEVILPAWISEEKHGAVAADEKRARRHVAFIPARAGSQGVRRKNVALVFGKPLTYWVTKAALDSKAFDDVYISTDLPELAEMAVEWGAKVHKRSAASASNTAQIEEAMLEFAAEVQFDSITMMQPTSPMLHAETLAAAAKQFRESGRSSLIGIVSDFQLILQWQRTPSNVKLVMPLNFNPANRPRRQDVDSAPCYEFGGLYMTTREAFDRTKLRMDPLDSIGFEVDPKEALDIDTVDDMVVANIMLEQRHKE